MFLEPAVQVEKLPKKQRATVHMEYVKLIYRTI